MEKVLAIIPARAGSKGIKNKNMRLIEGDPLINHTIEFCKKAKLINKVVISTNDNDIINNYSSDKSVEIIKRPEYLCKDDSLVIEAIRHALNYLKLTQNYTPEVIVLLECTSPLRSHSDLTKAIKKVIEGKADSSTVFKQANVSPNRMWKIKNGNVKPFLDNVNPFLSRQRQPLAFELTGQFYVISNAVLDKNIESISLMLGKIYPIISSSKYSIDIDNESDLFLAEKILKHLK